MDEVNKSIKLKIEKLEEMEEDRKEKERQISKLKNETKTLNEKVEQWIGAWILMNNIVEETASYP